MSATLLDATILQHAPLLAAPRYSAFEPLTEPGHRFITAEDGLWLELKRPWLELLIHLAETTIALPYGPMPGGRHVFAFTDHELQALLNTFIEDAEIAFPNECAAWGVWDDQAKRLYYRPCVAIDAGPGGIRFHRPTLRPHEHFAVDIHSHGALRAFFSGTDDADDRGEVKLSVVVGRVNAAPEITMRLCALGLFILFGGRCRKCGCTNDEPCTLGCHWIEPDLCSRCAADAEAE